MYGGGGYEGASQFAGGGFMPSQGAGAGPASASKRSNYDNKNQALRAFTVKQLHTAMQTSQDDQLSLDGQPITNVTLVGKIVGVQQETINTVYVIDDGTGRVTAKLYLQADGESEAEAAKRAELREGVYVRLHGHFSNLGKEKAIQAFNLRKIEDFNEVTYHYLQCIFQHLHFTRGNAGQGAEGGPPAYGAAPAAAPAAGGFGAPPAAAAAAGYNPNSNMSAIQADIMAIFNSPAAQTEAGMSVQAVMDRCGGRYTYAAVREAINFLQDEGHIYSTIDDQHYRSCSG